LSDTTAWHVTLDRQHGSFDARQLVRQACDRWSSGQMDTAQLLTTELVANALLHGHGDIGLQIQVSDHLLRVEVSDGSSTHPRPVHPPPSVLDEGGRGLLIVQALANAWGTRSDPASGGKTVWFDLHRDDT